MFNKTSKIVRIVALSALLAMVVLAPAGLLTTRVEATLTPFLKRPYYGAARSWNAVFDHRYPNYTTDGYVLRYDGTEVPTCTSGLGSACYDGHNGYDFPLTYEPVVASYPGTVVYSGWASPNHETSYGLEVEIDHGNGYHTLYGHLSMIRYNVGAQVGYYQIATSGTTGNSTGPHLHFEVRRQNSYGYWAATDPYGWLGGFSDPWAQHPELGGVASDWLWADDREQTPPTYSGTYYFDNDTIYFQMGCDAGTCPYWWYETTDYGFYGNLRYTLPNGVTPDYWARWNAPSLPDAGQYEVEVYVPYWDASNRSHAVRYELMRQEGVSYVVVVDQHAVGKNDGWGHWISLGRYNFAPATAYVKVTDAAFVGADAQHASYEDPQDSYHKILVDAVRWLKTH